MKRIALILVTLLAAGCAVNKPAVTVEPAHADYQPAAASALVFASPVTPSAPLLGLDRADREPSAFLGYEDSIVESYFIYTDDAQNDCPFFNSYDREAVYAKVGTLTR
jgi:hypothetical protein